MLSAFTETWHRGRRGAALVWVVAGRAILGSLPDGQARRLTCSPLRPSPRGEKSCMGMNRAATSKTPNLDDTDGP